MTYAPSKFPSAGTGIYWSQVSTSGNGGASLQGQHRDGTGSPILLSMMPYPYAAYGIGFGPQFLYWAGASGTYAGGATITPGYGSLALDGGGSGQIMGSVASQGICCDGTSVYFTTSSGVVWKMNLDGSSAASILSAGGQFVRDRCGGRVPILRTV